MQCVHYIVNTTYMVKKSDAKNIALVSTTYVRTYLLIKVKKPKKILTNFG